MRAKQTSYALQRHRQTFHLAQCDTERWEQEKETTLLESLHEVRESTSAAEKKVVETQSAAGKSLFLSTTRMSYRLTVTHGHVLSTVLEDQ